MLTKMRNNDETYLLIDDDLLGDFQLQMMQ